MAATISTTAVVIPVVITSSFHPVAINPKVPRPITTANPIGSDENSVRYVKQRAMLIKVADERVSAAATFCRWLSR